MLGLLPQAGIANSETALPQLEEIIARAIHRGNQEAENDLKFKQRYYFVRCRQKEVRNANGQVKDTKLQISTNAPLVVMFTPVMPDSDAATNATDLKSEVSAEVAQKFDKKTFKFDQNLASRFDFKLIGREQTNGVSLLVVDFAPKKTRLPENGIRDRVINRMAGRVWVDEREYAIQKCAVNLTESINIVGGIVGKAKKFNYSFERERTEDGLWYVRKSYWHLEGRQVVLHREVDCHETRTEVRKPVPAR